MIFKIINFLKQGEYNYAKNKFNKFSDKFIPFSIDTDFWKGNKKRKRQKILFIGNDGKRIMIAINLAKIRELEFTFVTKKIAKEDYVKQYRAKWNLE